MSNSVTLWFYVIDDDDKTEYVREGSFPTLERAKDRLNNIGSRWLFYPHCCITSDDTGEVLKDYFCPEAI